MDTNFLKAHAERCRSLAKNADEFAKRRLLDLAANYEKRIKAAGPSVATRALLAPLHLAETPRQILTSLRVGRAPLVLRCRDDKNFERRDGDTTPARTDKARCDCRSRQQGARRSRRTLTSD